MTRAFQNMLMLVLGGTILWITLVTGQVTDYVKPGLRYPLIACAVVLLALGAAGMRRDWHADPDHGPDDHAGHHHSGPRTGWLLCLPVLVILAIAPPELGAYTASRAAEQPAPLPAALSDLPLLPSEPDPLPLTIFEFLQRSYQAQLGEAPTLMGRSVQLTGFAVRSENGTWAVGRLQMSCCAADAVALTVEVLDAPAPADGTWIEVTGFWRPAGDPQGPPVYQIRAQDVARIDKPDFVYE
ncbi:putative repeat protein (TIGR03943 family) [Actinocorallia herbida]|uniref:Putative repeat protein (TIGR03943 family) n=1 Tax=Actinocorallia herbida TaxID=58109 RepID=A0A3N1D2D0_9ACTN|nr:TIGR03943 family protein [Actinocorallia herbida]ROO87693.1 putative repeat protein (TIGR03943 family) [Actinocorallia herbida]